MSWLLLLHIGLTVTSLAAAYAAAYCLQACRSSDWGKMRRELDLTTAALSSDIESIAHNLKRQHARLAARDRIAKQAQAESSDPETDAPPPPPPVNGTDADAVRKQLGAQAGMMLHRR